MRNCLAAILIFIFGAANAQTFGAGHVYGNPTNSPAAPTDATLTSIMDIALCATNGDFAQRSGGVWTCGTIPAAAIGNQTFSSPGAVTTLTLTNTPLPTAKNQITIFFDGIDQHPDTWSFNSGTQVITFNASIPANVQEVFVQWTSPNITSIGVNSFGGLIGTIQCGVGLDCSSISQTVMSQGPVYYDVKAYGAKDDCSTNDTTAFQNAINAAGAAGGAGIVYIPPVTSSGGCYLVGAINATNLSHLTVRGNGDQSLVEVHGSSSTNHNWWDLSGSNDAVFENFKVQYDGSTVPSVIFFAAAVQGVDVMHGTIFRHVSIDAHASQAIFYGYALTANTAGTTTQGSSGFACYDSEWIQRNSGSSAGNPSLRDTVMAFDGVNSRSLGSDYVTVSTAHAGTFLITLNNCTAIDAPSGFGSGIEDNNAAITMVNTGQFNMRGGAALCLCEYDVVMWSNSEDIRFDTAQVAASDGTVTILAFFDIGGGSNALISLQNVLFSVPANGGAFINFDAPSGGLGGVTGLNLFGPDIGGNSFNDNLILDLGGCTGFTPSNVWIANSYIQAWTGANNIASCGSIDSHTLIQNPGTIALPGGATDFSHHF